jgi:hypothetical protein
MRGTLYSNSQIYGLRSSKNVWYLSLACDRCIGYALHDDAITHRQESD